MTMNYYTAFGLSLASEIVCPELHLTTEQPSVTIRYGSLKHIPIPELHRSRNHLINGHQLLIHLEGIATFLVSNGSEIIIDPDKKTSDKELRLFLLGSAMGAILHQRGFLPIHGNGIVINGECIIFAGHSGKGKSTLAAAFAQKGFQLISDDLCAIKIPAFSQPLVLPGHPHVKLWSDSLKQIRKRPEDHTQVRPDTDKFFVPMGTTYYPQALPIKKIYILHYHDQQSINFQTLNKLDSLVALKNHTYKHRMVKKMNQEKAHYLLCSKLAQTLSVTRVFRPKDFTMINTLIEKIILENKPRDYASSLNSRLG